MAGFTHAGENLVIEEIFRKREVYIGLLKSDPSDQGEVNEVNGISYARQQIKFIESVDGQTYNELDVEFPTAKQNWGWISHIGFFSSKTGGDLIAYSELDYKKEIRAADVYRIPKAFCVIRID